MPKAKTVQPTPAEPVETPPLPQKRCPNCAYKFTDERVTMADGAETVVEITHCPRCKTDQKNPVVHIPPKAETEATSPENGEKAPTDAPLVTEASSSDAPTA